MPDYKQSKIYTITCEDGNIYVGSTIRTLEQRLSHHKSHEASSMYKYIHTNYNGDWSKSKMELYENYPCNSKKELEKKEGEVIQLLGTINKYTTGGTNKKFNDNKSKRKWLEQNREYLKKKIKCDCGCIINNNHIARHIRTNKHQILMENQINAILLFLECF